MFGLKKILSSVKHVARGQAQRKLGLQSPELPSSLVRLGRFSYLFSVGWIAGAWYSGYVVARTQPGDGPTLILPGTKKAIGPPARPNPKITKSVGGVGGSVNAGVQGIGAGVTTFSGVRGKIVSIAMNAANVERQKPGSFHYAQIRPIPDSITSYPVTTDCSGFVTLVYKAAGAPDPNGGSYQKGEPTSSYIEFAHGQKVLAASTVQPGDLVFFPDHVAVCIGHGMCVSHGSEGGPRIVSIASEAAYKSRGTLGYRSYV